MEPEYIFSEKWGWIGYFSDASYAFCNFHLDGFWHEGKWFPSVEHFFQFKKALFFSDPISAQSILKADSSQRAHMLGRMVKNFSKDEWTAHSRHIMKSGLVEKFTQNNNLLELLLESGDAVLAEANPDNIIWSCGIGADEKEKIAEMVNWPGKNLLGEILMDVRRDFVEQAF